MLHDQIDWSDPASIAALQNYLRSKLSRRYSRIDEHWLEASIEDALLHYRDHPEQFDASRGVPLSYYLWLRTRHYLDKLLQKVKRRRQHEKTAGVSEKNFEKIVSEAKGTGGIYLGKYKTEQDTEERREEGERRRQALDAVVADQTPHNRAGVELLRTGASREEWVRHLRIECLPQKDQQDKVNAEKDRLMKKLRRWARKFQEGS